MGTGAGGGTLGYRLAATGKKILLLERGDFVPRKKENWSSEAVFAEGRYTAREDWLDKEGETFVDYNGDGLTAWRKYRKGSLVKKNKTMYQQPNNRLDGQTYIVTRANSGIGMAIALAMGKDGANVVVNYVSHLI